jgi:hypothetical protein
MALAHLKRMRYGKKNEAFTGQLDIFDEVIEDLSAVEAVASNSPINNPPKKSNVAEPVVSRSPPICRALTIFTNLIPASANNAAKSWLKSVKMSLNNSMLNPPNSLFTVTFVRNTPAVAVKPSAQRLFFPPSSMVVCLSGLTCLDTDQ